MALLWGLLLCTGLGLSSGRDNVLGVAQEILDRGVGLGGEPGSSLETVVVTQKPDDDLEDRLAFLEREMRALKEENKYLRTKTMKTCADLRNSPYNETGVYTLDPDGSGSPVQLLCDMEKGVTEVGHNHEEAANVTWCEGPGCFTLALEYAVPAEQVQALIAVSGACEQEIKFECKLAPLKNTAFGVKYGWWTDQRGDKKYYFDGDDEAREVCDLTSNEGVCNCDISLVPLWNSDSGKITNKDSLPIKEFHYGGFFNRHQAARVTIGKLKCSGKALASPDPVSSCTSLKKGGLSSDGFYLTKDTTEAELSVNYCRLSSPGYREQELRVGQATPVDAPVEEFTIGTLTCTECDRMGRNYNQYRNQFYDLSSIQMSPNSTLNFYMTGTNLIAKKTGYFHISYSTSVTQGVAGVTLHLSSSLHGSSMIKLAKGDKISFKTTYNDKDKIMGAKITIKEL